MLAYEKDLENYICDNQEEFIEVLKDLYNTKQDIKFVGRQVMIGYENICDLLYYYDTEKNKKRVRTYIVVELKFRTLDPKDLAQISRYVTLLREKTKKAQKDFDLTVVKGLFVSFGASPAMQEIIILGVNDIDYVSISQEILFRYDGGWHHTNDYIEKIKLDERIERTFGEA